MRFRGRKDRRKNGLMQLAEAQTGQKNGLMQLAEAQPGRKTDQRKETGRF